MAWPASSDHDWWLYSANTFHSRLSEQRNGDLETLISNQNNQVDLLKANIKFQEEAIASQRSEHEMSSGCLNKYMELILAHTQYLNEVKGALLDTEENADSENAGLLEYFMEESGLDEISQIPQVIEIRMSAIYRVLSELPDFEDWVRWVADDIEEKERKLDEMKKIKEEAIRALKEYEDLLAGYIAETTN